MTDNTIAQFAISTEEDLRFQLDFVGLNLGGRTLKVYVRDRSTNALKIALTAPTYITLVNQGNLTVFYPRANMASWAKGEYEADVIDETGGSATRIMAVRFFYDEPGKLVYGVAGNQAAIQWGSNQAVVTAIGGVGPPGPVNVLTIGEVQTLANGQPAAATITGSAPTQVLNLGLPRGNQGVAGTLQIGDVTTGAPGSSVVITNRGTASAAIIDVTIPRGDEGEIGYKGWSPVFQLVTDSARRVLSVQDWVGGEGTKPATGEYVGAAGLTLSLAAAVDVRGAPGAAVSAGSIGTPELANGAVTEPKLDPTFRATLLDLDDLETITPRTSSTGGSLLSTGNTSQRGAPTAGKVRFNSETSEYEGGNGSAWVPIGGGGGLVLESPPTVNLREGLIWFSRLWGESFIYVVDANGGHWVSMSPVIDPSEFFLKQDALAGVDANAALTNLGFTALGKILRAVADGAAARAAIGAPALPATSGPGSWVQIYSNYGNGYSLPSGGTWAFFYMGFNTSGQFAIAGTPGIAAGGTTLIGGTSGVSLTGFAWRFA